MDEFLSDDLIAGLKGTQDDDARAALLFRNILDSLPQEVRGPLFRLATPHWFNRDLLTRLVQRDSAFADLDAGVVDMLIVRGLASQNQAGTTFAIVEPLRRVVLAELVRDDLAAFRQQSHHFATAFAESGKSVADLVEQIYHRIGAAPETGALLFDTALFLSGEPLFALDAVDRLVTVANEQNERGVLDEGCLAYLRYIRLLVPRLRAMIKQEPDEVRAILASAPDNPRFVAELDLRLSGDLLIVGGDLDEAAKRQDNAHAIFQKLGDARGIGETLRVAGRIALRHDEYAKARSLFDDARATFLKGNLTVAAAHCDRSVAEIDWLQGRLVEAERALTDALQRFEAAGSHVAEANTRILIAQILALHARFDEADVHARIAYEVFGAVKQRVGLAQSFKASGVILFEQGLNAEAETALKQALQLYPADGPGAANCKMLLAATLTKLDRFPEAEALLSEATEVFTRMRDRFSLSIAKRESGLLDERRKLLPAALQKLREAEAEFASLPSPIEEAIAGVAAGRVALALGFVPDLTASDVIASAERAGQIFKDNDIPRRLGEAESLLAAIKAALVQRA